MPQAIGCYWEKIRKLFNRSFYSSLHYAIATVNPDGTPHVTPIGSLILLDGQKGVYFEEFPNQLPANLGSNPRLSVLAVNSGKLFWLKSLLAGAFATPPGIRLYGIAGQRREATPEELKAWHRRISPFRFTKGYQLLWKNMKHVREIRFESYEPIHLGMMTKSLFFLA